MGGVIEMGGVISMGGGVTHWKCVSVLDRRQPLSIRYQKILVGTAGKLTLATPTILHL